MGLLWLFVWVGPVAAYINSTTIVVNGLAEYTTYYFQVYAGDVSGYDVNFFTPPPSASTLIYRTYARRCPD